MRLATNPFCLIVIAIVLFSSCRPDKKTTASLLNPNSLDIFSVSIDNTRDTVVQTPGGIFLHIPSNSFDAGGNRTVKLEIREALKMSEIIRAGLLTQTNGQPLSSGGMVQIEAAAGQSVKIIKSIGVSIPTPFIENKMQLYKGVAEASGGINWTDPQPLIKNIQTVQIDTGEQIFKSRCASCHGIDRPLTGPALAYISRLRNKEWLYAYTRNNEDENIRDRYANCLQNQYGKTLMPKFPDLTDRQISAVYNYIDNQSKKERLPLPADQLKKCTDSCMKYEEALANFYSRRNKLIQGNGGQVELQRNNPVVTLPPYFKDESKNDDKIVPEEKITKVYAPYYPAVYYQFSIKSFGWYNIDVLVSETDGAKKSELVLRLQGAYTSEINVFLIIPSERMFQQGGNLTGKENDYGFYSVDGSIYLQQSVQASVMAMGEKDGHLFFDLASFQTSVKQTIQLSPRPVSRDQMNSMMKSLDLKDITLQIQDSKNADAIRKMDTRLKDIEALKPKTCDCHCGFRHEPIIEADSTNLLK